MDTVVVALNQHKAGVQEAATALAARLSNTGLSVVLDDRDERAGKKLSDSELLGARRRIVVSDRTLKTGLFEQTCRKTGDSVLLEQDQL